MRAVYPPAVELIRQTEGRAGRSASGLWFPYHVGVDPPGVLTIYRGHKIVLPRDAALLRGITSAQGEKLFAEDVANHSAHIQTDVGAHVALSDWVYGSFSSFCYNLGAHILSTGGMSGGPTKVLLLLQENRLTAALQNIYVFCNANGHYLDGLFYRRLIEMYLGLTGELRPKPSDCQSAKQLMKLINELPDVRKNAPTDMLHFFDRKHVKGVCTWCAHHR